jgi:DNA mismatch endonuclease (patch repair protein)
VCRGSPRQPGETWISTPASKSLSGRTSRDTGPELALRRALHRLGLRFRAHTKIGERLTLDVDFTAAKVAVFVDGCYWHGCPKHPRTPTRGPNKVAWDAKFESVAEREQRARKILTERGYLVLRVRECEIAGDVDSVATRVEAAVRSRRHRP